MLAEVAPVTAEQLVAPGAREDDLDVTARELGHKKCGDQCTVGNRLIHVPQQFGQQAHDIGFDQDFMVVGAEQA